MNNYFCDGCAYTLRFVLDNKKEGLMYKDCERTKEKSSCLVKMAYNILNADKTIKITKT